MKFTTTSRLFRRTRSLIPLAALSAALLTASTAGSAQTAQRLAPVPDSVGVLLIAHGASPLWNARVDSVAAMVRRGGAVRGPVRVSYLMGATAAKQRFQDQVDSLTKSGAKRVVIVPMLVSSFSGHYEQVRFLARATDSLDAEMQHHLHMSGIERSKSGTQLLVTPALDDAAQLASVVADRARVLAPSASGRALMLFGHGPNSAEDYAAWMQRLRPVADSIRARSGFASVLMELVRDDAPAHVRAEAVKRTRELILLQRAATGQDVVVVPILMSSGTMGPRAIPADLAGLPIVYDGEPLLPHPAMAEWVVGRVRGALNAPKIED